MSGPIAPHPRTGPRIGRFHYSSVELFVALVLLLAFTPVMYQFSYGQAIEAVLMLAVFVASVLAVGAQGRTLWTAAVLLVPTVTARSLDDAQASWLPPWISPAMSMTFVAYVVVHLVRSTLRARQVDIRVLCTALSSYLLVGLLWATAYMLVARVDPDAFAFSGGGEDSRVMDRFNALYFSFVTLSTVGFGDITPVSKAARTLAAAEGVTGMLYVTVLIARLVALYSATDAVSSDRAE